MVKLTLPTDERGQTRIGRWQPRILPRPTAAPCRTAHGGDTGGAESLPAYGHLPDLRNAMPRDALITKIEQAGLAERRSVMNANSGEPWSEMDLWELMKYRRSFAEVAGFLYRDEEEVRDMAKALGLKETVSIGPRWVPKVGGSEEQALPIY
jgi:hypothetical protein